MGTTDENGQRPAPDRPGGVWVRLAASGAVAGGLLVAPAVGQDEAMPAPLAWTPAVAPESIDCRLTYLARHALARDPVVGSFNVGVTVRSHAATLWGSLPSAAHCRRAGEVVAAVPGVSWVRDEIHIEPVDPVPVATAPPPTPAEVPDRGPDPVLTGRAREPAPAVGIRLLPPRASENGAQPGPAAVLLPPLPQR